MSCVEMCYCSKHHQLVNLNVHFSLLLLVRKCRLWHLFGAPLHTSWGCSSGMLPSLGFAASSLRASGQVPDAVWCGSLAIIIEQCGSNKTSELFQSFRCFTVFFFFLTFEATLLLLSLILTWPHCHALFAIWRGHLNQRAQQASFTSASLANKLINLFATHCASHLNLQLLGHRATSNPQQWL